MSYLLAVGDSWTDADFESQIGPHVDCSFPKWPEVLGKQLGISKVVNMGLSGMGNDYMFATCYDKIIVEKPKLVCILLSGWDRRDLFNYRLNPITNMYMLEMKNRNTFPANIPWLEDFFKHNKEAIELTDIIWNEFMTVGSVVDVTLRNIFLFQCFCKQHNIDYLIMQGLRPIAWDEKHIFSVTTADPGLQEVTSYIKYTMKSPYTNKIDDSKLPGWPFFWEIGGYSVNDKFYDMEYLQLWVHPLDEHPNGLGHTKIADMFYKGYKDTYGKIS